MNTQYYALLLVAGLAALAGCGTTKEGTLASLDQLPLEIDIKPDQPIEGARGKAMDNYWEYMNTAPDAAKRVEAIRRLADLEMERSEERLQKQLDVLDKSQGAALPDSSTLREITYRGAIKLYEDALKLAVGGRMEADLLYQMSKAYEQAGQFDKSLTALDRLLTNNPNLDNREEVHFRRGELFFTLNDFKRAELAYTQAMFVSATSPYYEKALYKRGWSALKQRKYSESLHSFMGLLDRKLVDKSGKVDMQGAHLGRGDQEMVNDIFRAMVISFDELGGHKGVTDYFAKNGHRDYEARAYRELGDFFRSHDRTDEAVATYRAFVAVYPDHLLAPDMELLAMRALERPGYAEQLIAAKKAFVQTYRINGTYWNNHEEKDNERLLGALEKNLIDVARYHHAAAQKRKVAEEYQQAIFWYRQVLRFFPRSDQAHELNYLLAETLYENHQYADAAEQYEKTAYQYIRFGNNAEAGYAAIVAYGEEEKRAPEDQKERWSRQGIGAALRFASEFPKDPRAPTVLTKAAQDLAALGKMDQAAIAARKILELPMDKKQEQDMRRTAWIIIAQAEFGSGEFARAEVAYKLALNLTAPKDAGREVLEKGLAASVYKQAERMRASGNAQAAITQFQRVGDVAPRSDITVAAEFDVAASYMDAKNWRAAVEKYRVFRTANPTSPLAAKVAQNLAVAYRELNELGNAAAELEIVMAAADSLELKRQAAWQAAEYYGKSGDGDKELAVYSRFVTQFPSPLEQATEARQHVADIYAKRSQTAQQQHWLAEIVRSDAAGGKERTPRTRFLAAKAALALAEPSLQAFNEVQLVEPLKENLKRKKERMQHAVDAYSKAADYGVAEVTTAAVYQLAELYSGFSKQLMQSQRPSGLSADELEQYDVLLEEQAYPFAEKSIDIHEANAKRVAQGTYDQWVKKSFAALQELRPLRYAKPEKVELYAELMR